MTDGRIYLRPSNWNWNLILTRQVSHIIVHPQLNIFPAFQYVVPMSTGAQVEGAPPPAEYTVRLSLVQKINPECVFFQSTALINVERISRVLQRFVRGEQSMDNDVLTAIMVRVFIVYSKLARHPFFLLTRH